ncbi:hypothetical protein C0992_005598 [Termitomyces sp. T32_za158]|nr:hypothetical protein C0992_005598 [Termitomyces sp. T32_za158]
MRDAALAKPPSAPSDPPTIETSEVDQTSRNQRQRLRLQPTVEEQIDADEEAHAGTLAQNSSLEYVSPAIETRSRGTVVNLPNGGRLLFPPRGDPREPRSTPSVVPQSAVPPMTGQQSTDSTRRVACMRS